MEELERRIRGEEMERRNWREGLGGKNGEEKLERRIRGEKWGGGIGEKE